MRAKRLDAVDAGQLDVHQHQVGLVLQRQAHAVLAVHRLQRGVALGAAARRARASCSSRCLRRSGCVLMAWLGKVKVKVEPLAGLAVKAERTAVQLDEALASAPGPGRCLPACWCSGGRPGGTPRTPPPGRPCAMPMPVSLTATSSTPPEPARAHRHLAAVGRELHRVGQQVEQDLLELALVGAHLAEPRRRPPAPARCRGAARARAPASSRCPAPPARRSSSTSSSMRPASIFDRSRMSLISDSRCLPDEWMSFR